MALSKQQRFAYVVALLLSPIFLIFAAFGQADRGLLAMTVCGVFATVGYVKLDTIHKRRVWLTLLILLVAELAVIMLVRIPVAPHPGIVVLPFALLDTFLVLAILYGVERLVPKI